MIKKIWPARQNLARQAWLAIFATIIFLPLPLLAMELHSNDFVTLPKDKIIDSNYYAAGNTVEIYGTVNGDLFLAGKKILIDSENINGDIFAAGESITIKGKVNGSVRVAGSYLDLSAEINGNVLYFGQSSLLDQSSVINGHFTSWGESASLNGKITGQVEGGGSRYSLSGQVGKNVDLWIYNQNKTDNGLQIAEAAVIDGQLNYHALQPGQISDQATITGGVNYSEITKPAGKSYNREFFWKVIVKFFMLLVVGMVALYLWPPRIKQFYLDLKSKPMVYGLWGLLFLAVTPIASVILMITVIGLPLGIIILGLWGIMLYLAKVLAAWLLGNWVKEKFLAKYNWSVNSVLAFGILLYVLIGQIPIIGWVFVLVLYLIAWGSLRTLMNKQ